MTNCQSGPKESGEKQFIYISKIVNVLKDSGHEKLQSDWEKFRSILWTTRICQIEKSSDQYYGQLEICTACGDYN